MGAFGERAAGEYLSNRGYKILENNFRCALGEIDIIAKDGEYVVFVEVRTKGSLIFGTPEESITSGKKAKLIMLAESYIQSCQDFSSPWRIDVVAIEIGRYGKIARIDLIENAVD